MADPLSSHPSHSLFHLLLGSCQSCSSWRPRWLQSDFARQYVAGYEAPAAHFEQSGSFLAPSQKSSEKLRQRRRRCLSCFAGQKHQQAVALGRSPMWGRSPTWPTTRPNQRKKLSSCQLEGANSGLWLSIFESLFCWNIIWMICKTNPSLSVWTVVIEVVSPGEVSRHTQ